MTKQSKRLTPAQLAVFRQLLIGERKSAYDLRTSLNTLESLRRMGYLKKIGGLGAVYTPHTAIEWERIR